MQSRNFPKHCSAPARTSGCPDNCPGNDAVALIAEGAAVVLADFEVAAPFPSGYRGMGERMTTVDRSTPDSVDLCRRCRPLGSSPIEPRIRWCRRTSTMLKVAGSCVAVKCTMPESISKPHAGFMLRCHAHLPSGSSYSRVSEWRTSCSTTPSGRSNVTRACSSRRASWRSSASVVFAVGLGCGVVATRHQRPRERATSTVDPRCSKSKGAAQRQHVPANTRMVRCRRGCLRTNSDIDLGGGATQPASGKFLHFRIRIGPVPREMRT
jgi:hypothetical protein